jgi:hypothetical protein
MLEGGSAASSQFRGRLFLVSDPDAQRNAACRGAIAQLGGRLIEAAEGLQAAETGAGGPVFEIAPYRGCCVLSPDAPGVEQRTADWLALQVRTDTYVSPALSPLFRPLRGPPAHVPPPARPGMADPPPRPGTGVPAMFPVAIALVGFPQSAAGGDAPEAAGTGGSGAKRAGKEASSLEHDHALMMIMRLGALYAGSGLAVSGETGPPIPGEARPPLSGQAGRPFSGEPDRPISGEPGQPISGDGVDWGGVTHLVCCHRNAAAVARARPWLRRARGVAPPAGEIGSGPGEIGSRPVEIVHLGWLEACVRGWARVPEQRYRLGAQHLYHPSERGGEEGWRQSGRAEGREGRAEVGGQHSSASNSSSSSETAGVRSTARPARRTPAPAPPAPPAPPARGSRVSSQGEGVTSSKAPSSHGVSSHGISSSHGSARARREAAWEIALRRMVKAAPPTPPLWALPAFGGNGFGGNGFGGNGGGGGGGNAGGGGGGGGSGGTNGRGLAFCKPMMPSQIAGGWAAPQIAILHSRATNSRATSSRAKNSRATNSHVTHSRATNGRVTKEPRPTEPRPKQPRLK